MIKLPRIQLSNGSVEALKWLGLILMTGDHLNKYLLDRSAPALYAAGRLAMPIFVFVIAFNMARCDASARVRTMKRLALFGCFATPVYIALNHDHAIFGWLPLNIMSTLLVIVAAIWLLDSGHKFLAILSVVFGGVFVAFWWPAVTLGLSAYYYYLRPSWGAAFCGFLSCLLLCSINNNLWAFASVPVLLIVSLCKMDLPRFKWVFYVYYPSHLGFILALRSFV